MFYINDSNILSFKIMTSHIGERPQARDIIINMEERAISP